MGPPTLRRWRVAIRDKAFVLIRQRVVIETLPEELLLVLRAGKVSTNVYLCRLQNHCLGMGWLRADFAPQIVSQDHSSRKAGHHLAGHTFSA